MSLVVSASAPGKAVVSGEYAVLHGAAAVVMAVNRRARVTVEKIDGDCHEVVAPGYSDLTGRFRQQGTALEWIDSAPEPWALFSAVIESSSVTLPFTCRFSLDARAFHSTVSGRKLGFGSSAALAASLAMALSELVDDDFLPMPAAMSGHRDFQGGRGSGADVACSLAGGLMEYRMGEPGWTRLDWPKQLPYRFFFAGSSADTRERIERAADSDADAPLLILKASAEQAAQAHRSGNPRAIVGAMAEYVQRLRGYSDAADLGIFDAGHDVMSDAASDLGLVYKPCGAGGGDIGMAIGHEQTTLDVFSALATANGFEALEVELDPLGARVNE